MIIGSIREEMVAQNLGTFIFEIKKSNSIISTFWKIIWFYVRHGTYQHSVVKRSVFQKSLQNTKIILCVNYKYKPMSNIRPTTCQYHCWQYEWIRRKQFTGKVILIYVKLTQSFYHLRPHLFAWYIELHRKKITKKIRVIEL